MHDPPVNGDAPALLLCHPPRRRYGRTPLQAHGRSGPTDRVDGGCRQISPLLTFPPWLPSLPPLLHILTLFPLFGRLFNSCHTCSSCRFLP
jgi:hypothetical protein